MDRPSGVWVCRRFQSKTPSVKARPLFENRLSGLFAQAERGAEKEGN